MSLLLSGAFASDVMAGSRFREGGSFLFGKMTAIRGEIVETADRISPNPLRGIVWKRDFTITLGGANGIRETWSNTRIDGGPGSETADDNKSGIRTTLGADTQNMGWHVSGENQLQRAQKHGDSITLMTVTIDPGNRCAVTRKWLKRSDAAPGEPRAGGAAERYTPWRLLSAQCSIE